MKILSNEKMRLLSNTSKPYWVEFSTSEQEIYLDQINYPISSNKFVNWVKCSSWTYIISPLLLLCSLVVYIITPLKFLKKGSSSILVINIHRYAKRLLDISGAIIGLILCSGFFLIISILIKLDSNGPIFYSQTRVGKNRRKRGRRKIDADIYSERRREDRRKNNINGEGFAIFKFRTMREGAEKKCGPVWASDNDPRITAAGRFLRYTHIDEMPQLINILKGDMSFVGPRPERPFFVLQLKNQIPRYAERLKVKPGLTGLAQVSHGYDDSVESVKTKLNYDLLYCQNGNIYSYFKIIFQTIYKTMLGKLNV